MPVYERKFLRQAFFGVGPVLPEFLRHSFETPDETSWISLLIRARPLRDAPLSNPDPGEDQVYSFLCSTDNLMDVYREIQAELWRRGKIGLPDPAESDPTAS